MICKHNGSKELCFAYRKNGQCHCLELPALNKNKQCKFYKNKNDYIEELKAEAKDLNTDFDIYINELKSVDIISKDFIDYNTTK